LARRRGVQRHALDARSSLDAVPEHRSGLRRGTRHRGGGIASLEWSAFWRDTVPTEFPAYLAVQDGMTEADVMPELRRYHGIFVGGSLAWKLATGAAWAKLARRRGLRCHIGRVGTADRVHWARSIGATSIDSALPLRAGEHLDSFLGALGMSSDAGNDATLSPAPGVAA
jgi:hypothetical protein